MGLFNDNSLFQTGLQESRARDRIFFCVVILLTLAACTGGGSDQNVAHYSFRDPSGAPIKAVLKTAVPLGYAAAVAMQSVTETPPANAHVAGTCSSYPCSVIVTITDDNSSAPLQLGNYGTITVHGRWTSLNSAILTVSFGADAGSSRFPVHSVSVFPVSKTGSKLTVVYASIDIKAAFKDPGALNDVEIEAAVIKLNITPSSQARQNIGMDAWVVEADDNNTSDDVSDDTYSVSGGGQYINISPGSDSILQLALADVVMGAECALNPGSGMSVLNEVAISSSNLVVAMAMLSFHSSCDGKAEVRAASGNYIFSMGDDIPLHLDVP
jgi:hypothetical protein